MTKQNNDNMVDGPKIDCITNTTLGEPSNAAQPLISNILAQSVQNSPIGSLGPPSGTKRRHLRYYDSLYYTSLQFGAGATSAIEVGCSSDPFLKYLDWIGKRTCVAPYFIDYLRGKAGGAHHSRGGVERVKADFMRYKLPNKTKYDLLVCGQVLEHVPDPRKFLRKLIATAKTSIISVPYNWTDCGKMCNHVTHHITYETISNWSKPHIPIYNGVVRENGTKYDSRRMIVVFKAKGEL
ncbi:hypothetical protein ACHAXR_000618 [Thalassiosira sp. AJA248-18]